MKENDNELLELLLKTQNQGDAVLEILSAEELRHILRCDESELRIELASALVNDTEEPEAEKILLLLADNENELVRINAVDSLGSFPSDESQEALCKALTDDEPLVRAYAALSLADISSDNPEKAINALKQRVDCETDSVALIALYNGLYRLGESDCLKLMLSEFDLNDVYSQYWVLKSATDLLDRSNWKQIADFAATVNGSLLSEPVETLLNELFRHVAQYS